MTAQSQSWWVRAHHARDQLIDQFLSHPDVGMVDIGDDPQGISITPVLRIHLRRTNAALPNVPDEVAGIPVRLIHGDYHIQGEGSTR
jgi:hypothetical protein